MIKNYIILCTWFAFFTAFYTTQIKSFVLTTSTFPMYFFVFCGLTATSFYFLIKANEYDKMKEKKK